MYYAAPNGQPQPPQAQAQAQAVYYQPQPPLASAPSMGQVFDAPPAYTEDARSTTQCLFSFFLLRFNLCADFWGVM